MSKEAIEKLKEILWKSNGITSYRLLALYIKEGGSYDKPERFESLLGTLKGQPDIVYDTENDTIILYKKITVEITVPSDMTKRNCYDCPFRKEHDTENFEGRLITNIECALDVKITPINSMDGLRNTECPLNKAWALLKENNN